MKKLALASFLIISSSLGAFAQTSSPLPLRSPRSTVQQIYDVISDENSDAKTIYAPLSVDLQADLWLFQLEQFLAANPRLTPAQYALTLEAIGLLSTGVHHHRMLVGTNSADQATAALSNLTSRIRQVFARSEGLVFAHLGWSAVDTSVASLEDPDTATADDGPTRGALNPTSNEMATRLIVSNEECSCSSQSDWCWETPTSPKNDCVARPRACTKTPAGCGTFWDYACNGVCSSL